jgi:hypothetical protein
MISFRFAKFFSLAALCCAMSAAAARGQVLLDENFDDDAVGSTSNTIDIALGANGPGSDLEVVDSTSPQPDPFGPAGNHSLVFDNFNGGSANPNVWPFAVWNNELGRPDTTYRHGTLEFDLYMRNDVINGVDTKFWSYLDLRLGFNTAFPNTVGDTIVYGNFRVQDGVPYFFFDAATGPSNGHPIQPDTAHKILFTILPDETFTLQVDGNFVEKGGSKFVPWRATGPSAGFNVLAIGSAWGPNFLTNTPFWIDNLKVTAIPEPASLGLALAGLVFLARRRR